MKGRKVLLTAEHHNWGLSSIEDWQQTKYTLFDDGILQSVVFEGASVSSFEKRLSRDRLKFIRDNIKDFALNAEDSDGCDGDAWQFEGAGYSYHLGYIYGSELEKIADILLEEENKVHNLRESDDRDEMIGWLNTIELSECGLSARAVNSLSRYDITTLGQLAEILYNDPQELLLIRNLGQKSILEILAKLEEYGVDCEAAFKVGLLR